MSSKKMEMYDLSLKEKEILKWRYERRLQLRQEYLRETLNPIKQALPEETAVERFSQMRLQHEYLAKVKMVPHVLYAVILAGSIYLGTWAVTKVKDQQEHLYRTGQVKYIDREFKFG